MCLTLLTTQPDDFTVQLFGEYLFPRVNRHGVVEVEEVYDVFITARADLETITFTCISPHDLVSGDGKLCVRTNVIPGVDGLGDLVYDAPIGCGCEFDEKTRVVSATTRHTTRDFNPVEMSLSGRFLEPDARVPDERIDDDSSQIMKETGTIFELSLAGLVKDATYVLRLVVSPNQLIGMPERLRLEPRWARRLPPWKQQLNIIGPRMNHYNVKNLLTKCKSDEKARLPAARLLALISSVDQEVVRAEVHRIVVVLPAELEFLNDSCFGCIWRAETHTLSDGRISIEWLSGTSHYWPDESRLVAERVWQQLNEWSRDNPKPVESVTIALGIRQENSALILDALCRAGGAEYVDERSGLYAPIDLNEEKQREVFEKVQRDTSVTEYFRWTGFQIEFWAKYLETSPFWRWFYRLSPIIVALLALLGAVMSTVSVLVMSLGE